MKDQLETLVFADFPNKVKRLLEDNDFTKDDLNDVLRHVGEHRDETYVQKYAKIFAESKLTKAIIYNNYTAFSQALNEYKYSQECLNGKFVVASSYDRQSIVELLLKNGADINAHEGQALIIAIESRFNELTQFLLEHGADVKAQDSKCLSIAIRKKQLDLALQLIEKGANPAGEFSLSLINAAYHRDFEFCKLLIEKGADPADNQSQVLIQASQAGDINLVGLFLAKGANATAQQSDALVKASQNGHFEIAKLLIANGSDPKAQGAAALSAATKAGHTDIVKLLVEKGASPSMQTLYDAAENGYLEIITFLASKGMQVADKEDEALKLAAANGHLEIVKYLTDITKKIPCLSFKKNHFHVLSYIESKGWILNFSAGDEVIFKNYKILESKYLCFANPLVHTFELSKIDALLPAKNMHVALEMMLCMRALEHPDDIANVLTSILIKRDFNPEDFFTMPKTTPLSLPTPYETNKFSKNYTPQTRKWLALITNNQEANQPAPQQHM